MSTGTHPRNGHAVGDAEIEKVNPSRSARSLMPERLSSLRPSSGALRSGKEAHMP